ncbi:MAG: ABC transporter permease [Clostridia bacterium]
MKRYKGLLYNLVSKDITIKYRRSVLGVLWSVLNPLLMMVVMTIVFSQMFKMSNTNPYTGAEISFALYYLTASLIWNFVSEATNLSMQSIISAGPLIKKVYIPKYIFPLEKCMFSFVNLIFSLIAVVFVFAFMVITGKAELYWSMLLFPIPLIYTFIFTFGVSLILATAATFLRDVLHLYGVFLVAWMYLTPIFYPASLFPEKFMFILKLNPLYHYVKYIRELTLYGHVPGLTTNLICLGIALAFLVIGVLVFRSKQNKFVLNV